MTYRRTAGGAVLTTALALTALGLSTGPAQAASVSLFVRSTGNDANNCSTPALACLTVQQAVDVASDPANAGDDVTIDIGPGTFAGGVLIDAGTENSLTLTGAGAGPIGSVTTLTAAANPGLTLGVFGVGITELAYPVSVRHVHITGQGAPGQAGSGGRGQNVIGIVGATTEALTVSDTRIEGLIGGTGGSEDDPSGLGGDGGDVVGILRGGGFTTLEQVQTTDLRGGDSGTGEGVPCAGPGCGKGHGGGAVGFATSVSVAVEGVRISRSSFTSATGGDGVDGADGGGARGVLCNCDTLVLSDSELSDNRGGAGATGNGRDAGGAGGSAIGLAFLGPSVSVRAVTAAGNVGGPGGTGGGGRDALNPLSGGKGGAGGGGAGLQILTTPADTEAYSIANSTVTANLAGAPGVGGAGDNPTQDNSNGAPGGAGGDAATGAGLIVANVDTEATEPVNVTHLSTTANRGTPPGAGGAGGTGTGTGLDGASGVAGLPGIGTGVVVGGPAPTIMAASLLDNPDGIDCFFTLAGAGLVDAGYNVAGDSTCFTGSPNVTGPGTGDLLLPGLAATLGPLADNGGPNIGPASALLGATRTLALPAGSPAASAVPVSTGLCSGAFAVDQRGAPRPGVGAPQACAAGAYEPQAFNGPGAPASSNRNHLDPCGAITKDPDCNGVN